MPSIPSTPDKSIFNKERHIKYWLRCLKSYLPTAYTSNDSNRMTLAYFTVSALDLLGVLHEKSTASERAAFIDWIYLCQHPDGGFRGFTGTNFGDAMRNEENRHWDPANLAGTYFALAALAVLGDDWERVKRKECLEWLRRLQCGDGSFGEVLGEGGKIEGGQDVRYCFLAALVRWILRDGRQGSDTDVPDIDVEALASFVTASKSFEGGIAKAPFHEAHAGWTYCGLGALSLLGRLPDPDAASNPKPATSPSFVHETLHWLVSRQTSVLCEDEEDNEPEEEGNSVDGHDSDEHHYLDLGSRAPASSDTISLNHPSEDIQWAGFNGRCNKVADTCYSFWVGGTLAILKKVHLLDFNANRRFLLDKTQHVIGGFGKLPGDPPDILHSYFGLAALAIMKEPGLKSLDPTLCISLSARKHMDSLPWKQRGQGAQSMEAIDRRIGGISLDND